MQRGHKRSSESIRHRQASRLKVLMVAPQPFFRARGTPFSVLHRIRALCEAGHTVDLVTYPFGEDIAIKGLRIIRAPRIPGVTDVRIGPSLAKLLLDVPLFLTTLRLTRNSQYHVLHSHEEAAFFCAGIAKRNRLLHIYDMHSSLPQQLANFKVGDVAPVRAMFQYLERRVIAESNGVITICQELADLALPLCSGPHSMIENTADDAQVFPSAEQDVRRDYQLEGCYVFLYTGTFEAYQGLDLLVAAFAQVRERAERARLLMVGGNEPQIARYRTACKELGVDSSVYFVGSIHPSRIPAFLSAADAIVSPRSSGTNTPLKIYSYMRSGKPLIATNMQTHTQTLDDRSAMLVPPTVEGMAGGMRAVMADQELASRLAEYASCRAQNEFSDSAYLEKVRAFYDVVLQKTQPQSGILRAAAGD